MHTSKYYSNTKYAYYALRVIVLLGYELVLMHNIMHSIHS